VPLRQSSRRLRRKPSRTLLRLLGKAVGTAAVKRTALKRKRPMRKTKGYTAIPAPQTIEEELDGLCRQIILLRDGFCCRRCLKGIHGEKQRAVLQVHHIRTKGAHPNLRWELDNLILVCKGCHMFFFHGRDSESAAEWYRANLGTGHMEKLSMLVQVRKGQKQDRSAVRLYLQQVLAEISTRKALGPT